MKIKEASTAIEYPTVLCTFGKQTEGHLNFSTEINDQYNRIKSYVSTLVHTLLHFVTESKLTGKTMQLGFLPCVL